MLVKDTLPALLQNSVFFSISVCTFPTNSSFLRPFVRSALLWDRHYHEYDFLSNIIDCHVWAFRVFICLTSSILFAISGVTISATPDFPVGSPLAIHIMPLRHFALRVIHSHSGATGVFQLNSQINKPYSKMPQSSSITVLPDVSSLVSDVDFPFLHHHNSHIYSISL